MIHLLASFGYSSLRSTIRHMGPEAVGERRRRGQTAALQVWSAPDTARVARAGTRSRSCRGWSRVGETRRTTITSVNRLLLRVRGTGDVGCAFPRFKGCL
jgi:hypothetical protein